MDRGAAKEMRSRELPPRPPQRPRKLPTIPSQATIEGAPRPRKKKVRKGSSGGDEDDHRMEMGGLGSLRMAGGKEKRPQGPAPDGLPQRRRNKKKAAAIDLEDDQADLVNGDGAEQNTDGEDMVRKSKRRKKSQPAESTYTTGDFEGIEEDDIITDPPPISHHSLFSAPLGQSQSVGKVFIERNKSFQTVDRSDWRTTSSQMDKVVDFHHTRPPKSTRDISLGVHRCCREFGLMCQGFLAGFAVWNTVVLYMWAGTNPSNLSELLEQYYRLAYPYQSLLYMLLAVSTVAAFDRVNLAKGFVALRTFITLDPLALAVFFYFSALVLCLSQQMTADRMNLFTPNSTLWPQESVQEILYPWVIVNLVVALLVGLSWILIATRPEHDYTESNLMSMEIEPPRLADKSEMSA